MNKNVPKLRFKGFEDEWKEYKLGDFSEKITEKNKGFKVENVISNSAKNGLISQRDFFEKDIANKNNIDGYYIIKNGDFVYNPRKSNEAPYGPINKYKFKDDGVVSPLYFCFRINNKVNNDYLEEYFKSSKWYKYVYMKSDQGARHDRVSIKDLEVMKMKIKLPSLEEQGKVADFLSNVDKIIEEQEGKVQDLELYKKGMMQKIFKQEIRFKDDNGLDYPAWETTSIEEISQIKMGFTPSTKDDNAWNGDVEWLSIAGMTSKYIYGGNKKISYELLGKRELVPQDTLIMSFKLTIGRLAIVKKKLMTNEAICQFYWKNNNILNEYMYGYLSTVNISSFGCRAAKGITLNTESLNSIVVKLPCLEEQIKIANFLSNIDKLKEEEQKNLDDLREMKKGLLQQMFV